VLFLAETEKKVQIRAILDLFFLAALVHNLSFSLHIERRKINSELVQPIQLKRTGLFSLPPVTLNAGERREKMAEDDVEWVPL